MRDQLYRLIVNQGVAYEGSMLGLLKYFRDMELKDSTLIEVWVKSKVRWQLVDGKYWHISKEKE